jgi:hypothetical protein
MAASSQQHRLAPSVSARLSRRSDPFSILIRSAAASSTLFNRPPKTGDCARDLRARRPHIDAIDGSSIDLGRRVEPLGWRADQRKILRLFERHAFGNRNASGIRGNLTVFQGPSCRRVEHFTALHAGGVIDIPALCRRRHERGSSDRTRLDAETTTPRVSRSNCPSLGSRPIGGCRRAFRSAERAAAAPGSGPPPARRRSASGSRHRCLDHFHIRHHQDNLAIASDADEGVRCEAIGVGRRSFACCQRQP